MYRIFAVYLFILAATAVPVEDLEKEIDLRVPQPISQKLLNDCYKGPLDIVFVIDASSSIWQHNFTKAKHFIANFIQPLHISDRNVRIAVETYADKIYVDGVRYFNNQQRKEYVLSFIKNLVWHHGERTETGDGIKFMRNQIMSEARRNVRRICIVITDGDSQEPYKTAREAKYARDAGIQMVAVGVSQKVSRQELENIAGDPGRVYIVQTYSELLLIITDLFGTICQTEKPSPSPPCPCKGQ